MLNVNRIGLGAMRLTGAPAWLSRDEGVALARRAVELGVQFFDTADSYDLGRNEELLADALHPYGDDVMVATKCGRICVGGEWFDLGRPEYLRQQAELSLRRLGVDCLELLQLHRIDRTVPLADQVGALRRLQDEGKVRRVGLSEVTLDQLREAESVTAIASVQNRYNMEDRASEDVLDYCESRGIAFIPWRPVAPSADKVGALAWLLRRSPVMLPIPGTSSMRHLEENMYALEAHRTPV
jgi:aryl-alcohol dehydrogenase-like predicted oxidoreductase